MSIRALGGALTALVVGACALAWLPDSGLVPRNGGVGPRAEPVFLVLLVAAYAVYLVAVRRAPRAPRAAALRLGVAIQCAPLLSPLLLSTDAWSYWAYGWLANESINPYDVVPADAPANPALEHMGADWRDTTTVYGPVFTVASQPVAALAGAGPDLAAWSFKVLAAAAVIGAMLLLARGAGGSRSIVLLGWNPVVAIHAAGGGHNDAIVGLLVACALAAAATRPAASGVAWVTALMAKVIVAPLMLFHLLAAGSERRRLVGGMCAAGVVLGGLATLMFGTGWLRIVGPLADNAARTTEYSLAARLGQLGVPTGTGIVLAAVLGGALLLVLAYTTRRGRPRYGAVAVVTLAASPYLAAWYLAWVLPAVAFDDEDQWARFGALALGAYLLPHSVPL